MAEKKITKTKLPKKVNVLGHDWKVEVVHPRVFEDKRLGEAEYPKRIIRIGKHTPLDMRWPIFLHELKHAYDYESGMCQILDRQAEEIQADNFATFIMSLQKQGVL